MYRVMWIRETAQRRYPLEKIWLQGKVRLRKCILSLETSVNSRMVGNQEVIQTGSGRSISGIGISPAITVTGSARACGEL